MSLTHAFTVHATPEQAFAAINDVRGWWSGEIDGRTAELGDVFTYRNEPHHRSTQRIVESVPGQRVVWHVLDSNLEFAQDKTEWNGTDIVFDLRLKDDGTEVCFTHVGLVPAFECFEGCSKAWGFYVNTSLRNLITTGAGQPNQS